MKQMVSQLAVLDWVVCRMDGELGTRILSLARKNLALRTVGLNMMVSPHPTSIPLTWLSNLLIVTLASDGSITFQYNTGNDGDHSGLQFYIDKVLQDSIIFANSGIKPLFIALFLFLFIERKQERDHQELSLWRKESTKLVKNNKRCFKTILDTNRCVHPW